MPAQQNQNTLEGNALLRLHEQVTKQVTARLSQLVRKLLTTELSSGVHQQGGLQCKLRNAWHVSRT